MTDAALTLEVDGRRYTGWKRITVRRGIEQLAGEFELDASDQWALRQQPVPVLPGQQARVLIGTVPVITGFIDDVAVRYSGEEHGITFRGRDSSGDLVDCAARVDGQAWSGRRLSQIATDLCAPFGIAVRVSGDEGEAFTEQAINPGETVHELLARAAQLRGLLVMADGSGGVVLGQEGAGRASTVLELGRNILAGSRTDSQAERFRTYRVIGQSEESLQALAEAADPEIRAARSTVIATSDGITDADARRLATWTRNLRRARGSRVELVVRGWLDGSRPWMPNTRVRVRDAWLRVDEDWLIAEVVSALDERSGAITALTLVPIGAYAPPPPIEDAP